MNSDNDWDILVFTQRWPVTVCHAWQEKDSKNGCALPILRNIWTVHGIWPTKLGTKGPNFCNKTWNFDPLALLPLEQQLNIYWLNIEKNTPHFSLWEHEWEKHGTCAALLPAFDNEAKFFQQGLDWIGKYDMKTVLAKGGIVPNKSQGYSAEDIFYTIKSVLKKNPVVECVSNKKTGTFVSEIQICFDKNLTLTDCDGTRDPNLHIAGPVLTNCSPNKLVMYPDVVPVPTSSENETSIPWQLNFYRFLQFLIWITL